MQNVSQAWLDAQAQDISPQSYISLTFTKPDGASRTYASDRIISFRRDDIGSVVMSVQTQQSVTISLANYDGEFDDSDPSDWFYGVDSGTKVLVQYGLDIDGVTEWITGGWYFITEIRQNVNAAQTTFKASSILGVLNAVYDGARSTNSLGQLIINALRSQDAPDGRSSSAYNSVQDVYDAFGAQFCTEPVNFTEDSSQYTVGDLLQYAANACGRVLWVDHGRYFTVKRLTMGAVEYAIPTNTLYKWAELAEKPVYKTVVLSGRDGTDGSEATAQLSVASAGDQLDMYNPVACMDYAQTLLGIGRDLCYNHRTYTFDCRFDNAVDLFDMVSVEARNGKVLTGYVEKIAATYNGAWRASVTIRSTEAGVFPMYANEMYAGDAGNFPPVLLPAQ